MDKEKLIDTIAAKTGFTKKNTRIFLDVFTNTVSDALTSGDYVKIVGFGVFRTELRLPRVGRDKARNQSVPIPSRFMPVFVPGKALKENVQRGAVFNRDK